jgi:hypothetical protein
VVGLWLTTIGLCDLAPDAPPTVLLDEPLEGHSHSLRATLDDTFGDQAVEFRSELLIEPCN